MIHNKTIYSKYHGRMTEIIISHRSADGANMKKIVGHCLLMHMLVVSNCSTEIVGSFTC